MASKAQAQERVLRIGVIRGGKIVDDRYFQKREAIRIGEGPKNTFIVPGVTKSHVLFEAQKEGYSLAFTDAMQGQVAVEGTAIDFDSLKKQALVKKHGDTYVLALNEQSKGRVVIREVTLLFQFVPPPPAPPKVELPPELRGTFWHTVDHTFVGILASAFLVNAGFMGAVMAREVPVEEELTLEDIPDRLAEIIIPDRPPEKTPEELAAEKAAEEAAKKKAEEAAKKKSEEEKKKTAEAEAAAKAPKTSAEKEVERRKTVASKGLLKILGAAGPGAGGALADVFAAGGGIAGDLSSAFAGAGGVAIASEGATGGRRGGGAGAAAGIGDLATKGGGNVKLAAKQDVAVSGSVSFGEGPEVESTTVDKVAVGKYVQGRVKSLQGCYERELKLTPSLKGKVVIRITIGTNGRVSECSEEQNTMPTDAVAKCLCNYIRTWAFPFKPEEETAVTFPFLFTPSS